VGGVSWKGRSTEVYQEGCGESMDYIDGHFILKGGKYALHVLAKYMSQLLSIIYF
jgi:hypothetical protein